MALLRLKKVSIAFGTHALLNKAEFQLEEGERVGLLGRNGEGKSTLMKVVMKQIQADEGEIWYKPELRIAVLEQMPHLPDEETIYDVVAGGLGEVGAWIKRYHELTMHMTEMTDAVMTEMGDLQHKLDVHNGWQIQQRVENILTRLNLPAETKVEGLSGGWKRRVSLAKALVIEPEVLLLDEPTNHLDLESITWLEEQLLNFKGAILFVTHDRSFLQKLATRIIDLDRGNLVSWPGDYADYLVKKAASLEEESTQNALFDKKLAEEEVWIRQGVKARRTRNEGRVRALMALRKERSQRRNLQGTTKIAMERGDASGKKVVELIDVSFNYPTKPIVSHFSTVIQRGDKIGLIGPNGAGKTTFLKLLLKDIQPNSGVVEQGTKLQVAYFDQLREMLDPEMSVSDAIAGGNDHVIINGEPRHVISYLSDFLFAPARARSPIKTLSGGEKNRLLLAKLFTKPANLIIMDEPTNDLDMETLELLEERLVDYEGTLLIVSHDRAFLDNVVTSVIVFEGEGVVNEYVGGYSDWLAYSKEQARLVEKPAKKKTPQPTSNVAVAAKKKKLSFKEQKELAELPLQIDKLEAQQVKVNEKISDAKFYQQAQDAINIVLAELTQVEQDLAHAYKRWDELEAMQD
ncbi:MAG: ATP-binding cassette domain-containing protein [Methyloprofundus sp.]|nr:ATP-binding cassette domain-containing protein [Methyloprofundus sp.]